MEPHLATSTVVAPCPVPDAGRRPRPVGHDDTGARAGAQSGDRLPAIRALSQDAAIGPHGVTHQGAVERGLGRHRRLPWGRGPYSSSLYPMDGGGGLLL
jgi:hypothetical protein